MHIYIKNKKLFTDYYNVKCAVGKRGIKIKKREGDLITPKGKYKVMYIFFRKDRIPNLKTIIPKISINKNMGWCNDPKSKKYNKLIKFPYKYSAEKLYRADNIYDLILVLNYNNNPVIKNKGSAIFIHIAKKNYKSTEGCVAVSKKDLKKIAKEIEKKTIINIS
mgnify:FL=1